jgi:integrase/recombinase XerC
MTQVEAYLKYLRHERNYSRHTEISYYTDLCQFENFIFGIVGEFDIEQIDSDMIRRWVVALMEQKVSPRSISRKLSGVKSFYSYLLEHHLAAHNPARGIKAPKANKPLPSFVNYVDMKPLLDEESFLTGAECQFEAVRDHTLVELLYVTGMRRDELIKLRDVDVDFSAKQMVVNGKRNKQRIIPFSPKTAQILNKYLDIRNREVVRESVYFFVLKNGKPLYPMLVYRIVHRCLENISTLSKASPHVLRHSFATAMLNNGAEINAVKELLGHSSLASTEIYTHTSVEELKKIYEKAHPRA